jgi:hypothetical protein
MCLVEAKTSSAHFSISALSLLIKVMVMGSNPPALASKRMRRRPAAAVTAANKAPHRVTATILGADHRTLADI